MNSARNFYLKDQPAGTAEKIKRPGEKMVGRKSSEGEMPTGQGVQRGFRPRQFGGCIRIDPRRHNTCSFNIVPGIRLALL